MQRIQQSSSMVLAMSVALAAFATGCTTEEPDVVAGEFADGQGQEAAALAEATYPTEADWGLEVGQVVPNFAFVGYAASKDPAVVGLQLVSLAEFYNPNGYAFEACVKGSGSAADADGKMVPCAQAYPDAMFGEQSPWKGQPKPRALSLGISAVWCGPCNQEAKSILPGQYTKYKALGGQFLVALVDGPEPGIAANFADITKWKDKYVVEYGLMTDPSGQLSSMFPPSLPSNGVVRTSDMQIIHVIAGAPEASYWKKFEAVLASAN
ncbi:MAG: redoxin domain-containing protein [Myxococcales bacterium]|nr:redoxin domain-containing protein [Myxococcales bacterium]